MGTGKEELVSLKCSSCGGGLVKSSRTYYDKEEEEDVTVPLAKCVQCGKDYDQHTSEFYHVFADDLTYDKDSTLFKLGLKGSINNVEYEIIGRLRYQEEEEYEKCTWDEWVAISADGVFHYFVEEDGEIWSYEEYIPEAIDMESDSSAILFEGKRISKSSAYTGRIVLIEGELPWKPEIGEPSTCYDFKKDGIHFTIEQSEDEVSITKGEKLNHGQILSAFSIDTYKEKYDSTIKKRTSYGKKSLVYAAGACFSLMAAFFSCFSTTEIKGVMGQKKVLTTNVPFEENGTKAYQSQVLWGPFDIPEGNKLYDVSFAVDEKVQKLNLEWQSFRFMLISEKRLLDLAGDKVNDPVVLNDIFEEIDAMPEPLESYIITADFWDEEGRDSDGYWHESDKSYGSDFVLDEAGKYYAYMEIFSENPRSPDSVTIAISRVRGYRYYIVVFAIFIILYLINKSKSKSYNELPFEMADK
ncbi:MAG TPA: DUF4178 domain-containing protein [Spirochaetota bacterium]|nr:DUF4178 domain-containing protein [Spirochaetota bacterium]